MSATAFATAVGNALGPGVLFPADFVNWLSRSYYWTGTGVASTTQYNNTWLTYACINCRTSALLGQAEAIPPNEAPTNVTLNPASIAEDAGVNAMVGTLSSVDAVGDTFTYSLVTGTGSTDNGSFTIAGSTLNASASFDFEAKSSYSIRVRSTDQGGLFFERPLTVSVTNVNEPPTDVSLSFATIVENCPLGQLVGALSTMDPDAANTFTYSIVPGADGTSFRVTGNILEVAAPIDFEAGASRTLTVRSTDQGGLSTDKQFTITVLDVFEAPDGGSSDAGSPDAGSPDAGSPDAGSPDAGSPDAGTPDAGSADAGSGDAGSTDAGSTDAGSSDAGLGDRRTYAVGCDCAAVDQLAPWFVIALPYAIRRRRARQGSLSSR